MSVSRNRTLQPRRILLPATIPRAAIRLVAAVIAAQIVAAIVVETVVAIVVADVVAVGVVVVLEAVAAVVDIITARVDEIYLPQNTHPRRGTAIPAATITVAPATVSPALPWTRPRTISFSPANPWPNIAAVPFLLP
jgi:hypothetical protein